MLLAGVAFASWAEVVVATLLCVPLIFFGACVLYLLTLLVTAIPARNRVVLLTKPEEADSALHPTTSPNLSDSSNLSDLSKSTNEDLPRFVLLIPAHNEELLLGAALDKLKRLNYPDDRYHVVVIADNCSDSTARIARSAGALALERFDRERVGKGYALEDTLAWLMSEASLLEPSTLSGTAGAQRDGAYIHASTTLRPGLKENQQKNQKENQKEIPSGNESTNGDTANDSPLNPPANGGQINLAIVAGWREARGFDAVVVLDADTFVSANLLSVFADSLRVGERAIQARYDVLNTNESWRTRLMSCALALAHVVKPLGREGLRLSDGLKGNGMCFARTIVEEVPWSGESVTEDIEYALRLCRAGHRIAFVPEACVWAQMPTTGSQAASQRQRWEGGRYQLLFKVAPRLIAESLRTRNRLLLDRAIELIVPPFAEMFALPVLLGSLSALAGLALGWHIVGLIALAWAALLAMQAIYLFAGMWVARMPINTVLSLCFAPFYIVWKLGIYLVMAAGRSTGGWKRTERHELSK